MLDRITGRGRAKRCLLVAAAAGALLWAGSVLADPKPTPANCYGNYTVLVRGYFTGNGTANVSAGGVQIQVTVTDDAGVSFTLSSNLMSLLGDHFSGSLSGQGLSLSIQGYVESADSKSGAAKTDSPDASTTPVVTNAKISATFSDGKTHHGGKLAGPMVTAAPAASK